MKRKEPAGAGDYLRFSSHLKRYAQAKREARLLRFGESRGEGESLDREAGVHPWIEASRRARAAAGSPGTAREGVESASQSAWRAGRRRAVCAAGVVLLAPAAVALILAFASLRAARPPLPAGPVPAAVHLEVWHALGEEELRELGELAASLSGDDVRFELLFRPDLADALRAGALVGDVPALAIVELETAWSLARLGALVPLSSAGELYIPLARPAPWTRPLVAVALRGRREGAAGEELIREFVRSLAAMRAPGG